MKSGAIVALDLNNLRRSADASRIACPQLSRHVRQIAWLRQGTMRTTRLCASLVLFRLSEKASQQFVLRSQQSSIARSRCTMSCSTLSNLTFPRSQRWAGNVGVPNLSRLSAWASVCQLPVTTAGSRRWGRTLPDALENRGRDAREHGLGLRGL